MHTVKSLREKGYRVKVHHIRRCKRAPGYELVSFPEQAKNIILPTGGITDVTVVPPNGGGVNGIAHCSMKDNYNKKRGVMIALGRAMKQI